jgi:RNA 3'-terminal phosphate cyclase
MPPKSWFLKQKDDVSLSPATFEGRTCPHCSIESVGSTLMFYVASKQRGNDARWKSRAHSQEIQQQIVEREGAGAATPITRETVSRAIRIEFEHWL